MLETLLDPASLVKVVVGMPLVMAATNFIKDLFPQLRVAKDGVGIKRWVRLINFAVALVITLIMGFGQFYFLEMEWRSKETYELLLASVTLAFLVSGGSVGWYHLVTKKVKKRAGRILGERAPISIDGAPTGH